MSFGTLFNHRTFENPKRIFCEEFFVQSDFSIARINGILAHLMRRQFSKDANYHPMMNIQRRQG